MRVFYTMNANFDLPKSAMIRAINHVLKHEEWAIRDLKMHRGKVIELIVPIGSTQVEIRDDSLISVIDVWVENPDLILEFNQQTLTMLSSTNGSMKERAMKAVKITGDAELAQLIAKLTNQLRWEYEEDLAKIIGDAPAHFVTSQTRRLAHLLRQAALDLQNNISEYLSEEKQLLLHKRDFVSHKIDIQDLRDAVERLEKRISYLQKSQDSS